MKGFFESLNYTSVNEDWRTEAEALGVGPGDRVLCITGSGARALDLLAFAPAALVAIDLAPAQSRLLELKAAALGLLSRDDAVRFLGLQDGDPRWRNDTLRALGVSMDRALVSRGVLYEGRWERHHRRLAALARRLRPGLLERLFELDRIEDQRALVETTWDTPAWRLVFEVVMSPLVNRLAMGDPAYYRFAASGAGRRVFSRMKRALLQTLARESFMLSLVLRGVLSPLDLPPHLTEAGLRLIRPHLSRLTVVTGDVLAHLRAGGESYTAFSLSDVPSFLSPRGFEELLSGLVSRAAPGARFAIRQFLTRYEVPERLSDRLVRDRALEERLAVADRSFAYDFLAGRVAGG